MLERHRGGSVSLIEQCVHGLGHPPELPKDQPHHTRVLVETPSEGAGGRVHNVRRESGAELGNRRGVLLVH